MVATINDKYEQDIEKCKEIGTLLNLRYQQLIGRGRKGVAQRAVAKPFSELTGLRYFAALNCIQQYCGSGPNCTQISSEARRKAPPHLERLALFYALIGIEENDRIVQLTREVNPAFQYPYQMNSSSGGGQGLEARCDVPR